MKPNPLQSGWHRSLSWVLQLLVAGLLVVPAWNKLTSEPYAVELFAGLGMEPTGRYAIGVIELAAVALLLLPSTAVWGALLAFSVMVGAFITHLTRIGFGGDMLPTTVMWALVSAGAAALLILHRCRLPLFREALDRKPEPEPDDSL